MSINRSVVVVAKVPQITSFFLPNVVSSECVTSDKWELGHRTIDQRMGKLCGNRYYLQLTAFKSVITFRAPSSTFTCLRSPRTQSLTHTPLHFIIGTKKIIVDRNLWMACERRRQKVKVNPSTCDWLMGVSSHCIRMLLVLHRTTSSVGRKLLQTIQINFLNEQ